MEELNGMSVQTAMRGLWIVGSVAFFATGAHAQMDLTARGVAATENFSGFSGTGFAPSPGVGQLDSDTWRVTGASDPMLAFGGTGTSGDYARGASPGGVSTGGIYAFDAAGAGNPALGAQSTGSDFNPGGVVLRLRNQVGRAVTELRVEFDLYIYNDQSRSTTLTLQHSATDGSYTDVISQTTPVAPDLSPSWVRVPVDQTISGVMVGDGAFYFVRFSLADAAGSGSRDEVAFDNFRVTATMVDGGCSVSADCVDGNACTTDDCAGGLCVNNPVPVGTSCADADMCNGAETCAAGGVCAAGMNLNCNDDNACTMDRCVAATGCANMPIPGCGMEGGVPDGSVSDGSIPDGSMPDGRVPDANIRPDSSALDATATADASGRPMVRSRSSGCNVAAGSGPLPVLLGLLGLGLLTRRRRS
ncbi:MAG: MYXO-CTERM sorting domain-containing protein [Myxococcota bacterium]